jgi:hypothetical protein
MKKRDFVLVLFFFCLNFNSFGQKGVTTFGIQYKPIIPNRFIGTYEQRFDTAQFFSSVRQKIGHSFGGVVRVGLTKNISLETGLNLTYRNFNLDFSVPDSGYVGEEQLRVVSYEIPVSCLIYIQLSKNLFINTSLGAAMTFFASDVRNTAPISGNEYFLQEGVYRNKIQGALLANLGFEYRTKQKGYFYFGTSYHLPFSPIMTFAMSYEYAGGKRLVIDNVLGSYLTLDFRYFFHESPDKK